MWHNALNKEYGPLILYKPYEYQGPLSQDRKNLLNDNINPYK